MSVGKEVVAVAFVRPQAWGRTGADALPLPQGTKPVLHDSPPPVQETVLDTSDDPCVTTSAVFMLRYSS
jgi:hypothetical protein